MSKPREDVDSRHQKGLDERVRVRGFSHWIWDRVSDWVGRRVLEVGCGRAALLPWLQPRVERYLGVDGSEEVVRANRRRYGDRQEVSFQRLVFPEDFPDTALDRFAPDTVLCLNLLEHVRDDRGLVGALQDVLEPGGTLIVQVPAHPWLYGSIDRAVGHHRRYDSKRLRELLDAEGFREITVEPFNAPGILPWWLEGTVLGRRDGFFEGQSERALRFYSWLMPLVRWVDDRLPVPVGLSLFGFARRPPDPPR